MAGTFAWARRVAPAGLVASALALFGCQASTDDGPPDPVPVEETDGPAPTTPRPDARATDGPAKDAAAAPDGGAPALSRIAITELMYHPVLEDGPDDEHEFIELHNPGKAAVDLAGWKLSGDAKLTFASGAAIPPGGFLVVAKKKARLPEAKYDLAGVTVVGDYEGKLDNGGGTVVLSDGAGAEVDRVKYDSEAPWPIGADAIGASEGWLSGDALPLTKHRFGGRSLERISLGLPASDPRNWEASALGGATPGRANSVAGDPGAIVLSHTAARGAGEGPIRKEDEVRVTAQLSAGAATELAVEWFVDALDRTDEKPTAIPLEKAAGALAATIPPQPAGSIVRYRIVGATAGRPAGPISPRASDPFKWHAYFVGHADRPAVRSYEILIAPRDWTKLWTNLAQGPVTGSGGCTKVPSWDARVPAVFVYDGQVYDVQARHQGSRYQRRNGQNIPKWTAAGPSQPAPLKVLSWNLKFPSYRRFDKKKGLNLNKVAQGCPGQLNALEARLLWEAGIPSQRQRFARVYINGGYYHYMMEVDTVDEQTMEAVEGAGKPIGDLFKSDGVGKDSEGGAAGFGGFTTIAPYCTYQPIDRYQATYERQTNEWLEGPKGHEELIALIEGLKTARAAGDEAVRAYFQKHFDIDALAAAIGIRNFAGVWDDVVHNFYLYKRPKDGKWIYIPQDFDLDWGGDQDTTDSFQRLFHRAPTVHFYLGEEGTKPDGAGGYNHLKSSFLKAFRPEYKAKLRQLSTTVLSVENMNKILDEENATFDMPSWMAAPAPPMCNVTVRIAKARTWIAARHMALQAFLAAP